MSSLLQFDGEVGRRGVRLEFMLPWRWEDGGWKHDDLVPCGSCGKSHPQVHAAWRRPAGMFGPWVVFRYNGAEHAPDLSIPIDVKRLPRDARRLSAQENCALWHRR